MGGPNKSDEGEKISKPNKRSVTSVGHLRVSKVSPESSLQFEFHLNNSGVKHITSKSKQTAYQYDLKTSNPCEHRCLNKLVFQK